MKDSPRIANLKILCRRRIRRLLSAMKASQRASKSRKICARILETKEFTEARNLLFYMPLPGEVDLRRLFAKSLKLGKRLYFPRLRLKTKDIEIRRIQRPALELRRGAYGILEPIPAKTQKGQARDLDLLFIPGLGFDSRGGRLGRGGGYFDRFLKKVPARAIKIGVAFREQRVARVPAGPRDVRMDWVITD